MVEEDNGHERHDEHAHRLAPHTHCLAGIINSRQGCAPQLIADGLGKLNKYGISLQTVIAT